MWPIRTASTLRSPSAFEPMSARFDAATAVALAGADDLLSLEPAFLAPMHDEFGVEALAAKVCPVLLADHSVAIFAVTGHEGSDQADALAQRARQHGYRLAEPQRYVVAAPLLLAIVRRQFAVPSTRPVGGHMPEASRTALAEAFQDMIEWGVRHGASDMHLNVDLDEPESEVRYTVGGRYVAPECFRRIPTSTLMDILAVAWMDIRGGNGAVFDPTMEQQGRLTRRVDGRAVVLRWASLAADRGPSVCLRLLEREPAISSLSLEALGYSVMQIAVMERAVQAEGGAIVFSGTVGSGKSTTLASLITSLPESRKVVTIEDPVEYVIPRAIQNTVARDLLAEDNSVYMAKLMAIKRSAMTDVLLGEIRDQQTGRAFMDLAGSGVNLYTTVHAPSAALTGERLASDFIGVSRDFLATPGVLKLIVHQSLLSRLCGHCSLPATSPAECPQGSKPSSWRQWLARIEKLYERSADSLRVRNEKGCAHCLNPQAPALAGYAGRTVVAECIEPRRHPDFLRTLRDGCPGGDLRNTPSSSESSALYDAMSKAFQGDIDPRDIESRFPPIEAQGHHPRAFTKAGPG
ncbi:MAG TPA: ATPase, T2SS/T4P/T4SS family [Burkholderiaceae bacterium]|nr:ATPase, T2SS/T4P/T4SS family [Burkholderiaceae bacterium]